MLITSRCNNMEKEGGILEVISIAMFSTLIVKTIELIV